MVLLGFTGFYRVLPGFIGSVKLPSGFIGFRGDLPFVYWVVLSFLRLRSGLKWFYRVLPSFTRVFSDQYRVYHSTAISILVGLVESCEWFRSLNGST